jgi:hypothetical protein
LATKKKSNKTQIFLVSGIVLIDGVVSVSARTADEAIKKATAGKFDEIEDWNLKKMGFSWDGRDVDLAKEP